MLTLRTAKSAPKKLWRTGDVRHTSYGNCGIASLLSLNSRTDYYCYASPTLIAVFALRRDR
jgi:hypothetical protein